MSDQSMENTISLEGLPTFEQFWSSFQESKKDFDQSGDTMQIDVPDSFKPAEW